MVESPDFSEEMGHERFSIAFRGYDRDEVDAYVAELEEMVRSAPARPGSMTRSELAELLGDEVGAVLAAAEEAAQTIRERAQKEVAELLSSSKAEAEKILSDALTLAAGQKEEAEAFASNKRQEAELMAERLENAARQRHDQIIQEAVRRNKTLEDRERELLDRIDALEKAFVSMRHAADDIYKHVGQAATEAARKSEPKTKTASASTKNQTRDQSRVTDRSKVVDLTDSFEEDEIEIAPTQETKRPK